MLENYEGFSFE